MFYSSQTILLFLNRTAPASNSIGSPTRMKIPDIANPISVKIELALPYVTKSPRYTTPGKNNIAPIKNNDLPRCNRLTVSAKFYH